MFRVNKIIKYFCKKFKILDRGLIKISSYLISLASSEEGGELLSNLKLQKLLYYCQGFYYAKHGKTLFRSPIIAWQYGPVVKEAYHTYKQHGHKGIPSEKNPSDFSLNQKEKEMIDDVYGYFNQFSAIKLMNMTHSESPWVTTAINEEISLDKLKEHFRKFLKE